MMMKAKDIYMYGLGAIVVVAMIAVVALLIFMPVPAINKDLLNIVLGVLISQFASVIQYFFGSSQGSKDKGDIISNQIKTANPNGQ